MSDTREPFDAEKCRKFCVALDSLDGDMRLSLLWQACDEIKWLRRVNCVTELIHERENAIKERDRALRRLEAADGCVEVVRHAIELGYFDEGGSTRRWAEDSLAAYDAACSGREKK